MPPKTLIFIPTYNERENAPRMCEEIHKLGLDADVLFVDDNSPDGTGQVLESLKPQYPRLLVQHRSGKLGVGSAHLEGIKWAYDERYELLVTMDCDFTHQPSDIPALIAAAKNSDVSVGSRWVQPDSLPGWNMHRRLMTWFGHFLTKHLLRIPQDATGAFRVYRLERIPFAVFTLVKSTGYAFFFESLFSLNKNGFAIAELPIVLPARVYGHSKVTIAAAWQGFRYIFDLFWTDLRRPDKYSLEGKRPHLDPLLRDPQGWDDYWAAQSTKRGAFYEFVAGIYRRMVIKRALNRVIRRCFPRGSTLLHAGCGSGQVDQDLQHEMRLTALDISPTALELYAKSNPAAVALHHGSILELPFGNASFDGVYNLGVVEHFSADEIRRIFSEFRRVLRPNGKIVIFWPHRRATSVAVMRLLHWVFNDLLKRPTQFHPPEISLLRSKHRAKTVITEAGLELCAYEFGIRDFFVQAVVVAVKRNQYPEPLNSQDAGTSLG